MCMCMCMCRHTTQHQGDRSPAKWCSKMRSILANVNERVFLQEGLHLGTIASMAGAHGRGRGPINEPVWRHQVGSSKPGTQVVERCRPLPQVPLPSQQTHLAQPKPHTTYPSVQTADKHRAPSVHVSWCSPTSRHSLYLNQVKGSPIRFSPAGTRQ
jgi:hypothetical protein